MNITDVPRPGVPGLPDTEGLGEGGGQGWAVGVLRRHQPALQHSVFTGQRGNSPQVFPDFNEFRGVVLFLFWWFFQLKDRGEVSSGWD